MYLFPPRESWRSRVSLESLYGTWVPFLALSPRAEITFPKASWKWVNINTTQYHIWVTTFFINLLPKKKKHKKKLAWQINFAFLKIRHQLSGLFQSKLFGRSGILIPFFSTSLSRGFQSTELSRVVVGLRIFFPNEAVLKPFADTM